MRKTCQKVFVSKRKHQFKTYLKTSKRHSLRLDEGFLLVVVASFHVQWLRRYTCANNEQNKKPLEVCKKTPAIPNKFQSIHPRKVDVRDFCHQRHTFFGMYTFVFSRNYFSVNIERKHTLQRQKVLPLLRASTSYILFFHR